MKQNNKSDEDVVTTHHTMEIAVALVFAAVAVALHFIYSVNAVSALVAGVLKGLISPRSAPARYTRRR